MRTIKKGATDWRKGLKGLKSVMELIETKDEEGVAKVKKYSTGISASVVSI